MAVGNPSKATPVRPLEKEPGDDQFLTWKVFLIQGV